MNDLLARLTMGRAMLLGMGLAAVYYFTFFDSGTNQVNSIANAKTQVSTLQKQLHEDQVKLDRAIVFKQAASETGSTINKLLTSLPENFGNPDLMKLVFNETKVAGTSLMNITPGKSEISALAKEFEELTVSIDMSGSFLQSMVFLSNLTKINQILVVRKFAMALSKEAHGDEPPVVHMTADIVAYRYRGANATSEK